MGHINERLVETRSNLDMTQEKFAERLQVPVKTLRNWEQGIRQPRGLTARLLDQLLKEITSEKIPPRKRDKKKQNARGFTSRSRS